MSRQPSSDLKAIRSRGSMSMDVFDEVVAGVERLERSEKLGALALKRQYSQAKVKEPLVYEAGSPHSWFKDAAAAVRMSDPGAKARLDRHHKQMAVEMPRLAEKRQRAARDGYERTFGTGRAGYEALARMAAAGISAFETRALTRTDGQGGYAAPPIWMVDQFVAFAREASPFASLWTNLPLPPNASVVNVPRLALGTAVGAQSADASPAAGRDLQDSLVNAPVRTVAGTSDVSRQWLDQGQGSVAGFGLDQMVFADLTADLAQNVDGQLLIGAGANGQLLGVWPAGAIAAANGIVVADGNNATGQAWTTASSGTTLHVYAAQAVSLLRRLRALSGGWKDVAWIWHPFAWSLYTAQVDSQNRPLVLGQNLGALPDGAAGEYQDIAVYLDSNIPTTFGGSLAPAIGPITNGQYAAVPGNGTYTPLLLARPKDLYIFQGDIKMQILSEVLSGSAQIRFQAYAYLASMPHRFVAAAAVGSSVSAGGDVAHATVTWQQTNSLLQLTGGY